MGAGASAAPAKAALAECTDADLSGVLGDLPQETREKLREALASCEAKAAAAGGAASEAAAEAPAKAAAEATVEAAVAGDAADGADDDEIPASWGWPKEPFDACFLRQYVLYYTKNSAQESWDNALAERSVGGSFEDFLVEKAYANLLLNKEGTGEDKDDKDHRGIDPNAYKRGRWYRFLNAKGDCNVYVHNFTCDIQASRPENFTEMTSEEQARLRKLGVYIKDLPEHLAKVYDRQKQIPIVFASEDTADAIKKFAEYAKEWQLLDCSTLKRVNTQALESARKAIVNAMMLGKMLCIYLGDHIPDLQEKVCTSKNREYFPIGTWQHSGLLPDMVKEKIYRDGDKEGGQCVVRDGFRVCVVLMYDNMTFEMSSMRKDELPGKIPNFQYMEQVRCYADHDIKRMMELHG